jgi:hypothetical protein
MANGLGSHEDDPRAVAVFSETSTQEDVVRRTRTLGKLNCGCPTELIGPSWCRYNLYMTEGELLRQGGRQRAQKIPWNRRFAPW